MNVTIWTVERFRQGRWELCVDETGQVEAYYERVTAELSARRYDSEIRIREARIVTAIAKATGKQPSPESKATEIVP